jgi:aspartyl protease family protein
MRDALIFTALTLGAIAALFPKAELDRRPPQPQQAAAPAVDEAKVRSSGSATELHRAADGHFYAGVTVGTRPVTMLVDTGASVIALTGRDAREAGLHWNPAKLAVVAQGAGGDVRGVAVTLDRVVLGGHEARGVEAVIIPEGLPISLLGQSFLRAIEPVRIEKDRMILGETPGDQK